MNQIERQILKNQRAMLECLWVKAPKLVEDDIYARMKETDNLLNPITEEEPCCEMPKEFGLSKDGEVKK